MERLGLGNPAWLPMIFQGLAALALLIGLVFLIIFLAKASRRAARRDQLQNSGSTQAIEIVNARYAKGEITEAEHKKILADLKK